MTDRTELRLDRGLVQWILLAVGLLALLVFVVAYIATPTPRVLGTVHYVALVLAVAGIVGWIALDPQNLARIFFGRTGQQAGISLLMTIAFLALVIAAYYILYDLTQKGKISPWDLTEAQKYNLSDESIQVLEQLDQPVHVYAFYGESNRDTREEVELWLQEYVRHSDGLLTYEFVDPDRDPGITTQLGGRSDVMIFKAGDRTSEATFPDESSLTQALVRVLLGEPQTAYMITGHGERSIDDPVQTGYSQMARVLENSNINITALNLLQEGSIPEDADLVIIAGPTGAFAQPEVEALSGYLNGGGALMLMMDQDPEPARRALVSGVFGVEYSPDGSRILTAGADGSARLWDADSGEELLALYGHTGGVQDAVLSPDGSRIVTAGGDGSVRVWDAQTGEEIAQLAGDLLSVFRVAYSPDGRYIASAGGNQVVNLWDAQTFESVYPPLRAAVPLYTLSFSPDGSMLAAGGGSSEGRRGDVYVWDVQSGEELLAVTPHTNLIYDLAFTPEGDSIRTTAVDGSVGTLDVESGESGTETLFTGINILALTIDEDGAEYFGLSDGTIHVRDADGDEVAVIQAHDREVWDIALNPDTGDPASASADGTVKVWDVEDQEATLTIAGHAAVDPLLDLLATQWGIQVHDDVVIDRTAEQATDAFTPIIVDFDAASPVTQSLADSQGQVVIQWARSLAVADTSPEGVTTVELARTFGPITDRVSGQTILPSWGETDLLSQSISYDPATDIAGPVTVAVSAENTSTGGRVVVFGDADFASNAFLSIQTVQNSTLVSNAATWLAGTETNVPIPPPDFTMATWDRPLGTVALRVVQITATCLIPLAMVVIGAVVWFVRRRRR